MSKKKLVGIALDFMNNEFMIAPMHMIEEFDVTESRKGWHMAKGRNNKPVKWVYPGTCYIRFNKEVSNVGVVTTEDVNTHGQNGNAGMALRYRLVQKDLKAVRLIYEEGDNYSNKLIDLIGDEVEDDFNFRQRVDVRDGCIILRVDDRIDGKAVKKYEDEITKYLTPPKQNPMDDINEITKAFANYY